MLCPFFWYSLQWNCSSIVFSTSRQTPQSRTQTAVGQMWREIIILFALTPCMHGGKQSRKRQPSLPQICLLISIYLLLVLTCAPLFQLCFWRLWKLWSLVLFHSSIGIDSCFLPLNAKDACIKNVVFTLKLLIHFHWPGKSTEDKQKSLQISPSAWKACSLVFIGYH